MELEQALKLARCVSLHRIEIGQRGNKVLKAIRRQNDVQKAGGILRELVLRDHGRSGLFLRTGYAGLDVGNARTAIFDIGLSLSGGLHGLVVCLTLGRDLLAQLSQGLPGVGMSVTNGRAQRPGAANRYCKPQGHGRDCATIRPRAGFAFI